MKRVLVTGMGAVCALGTGILAVAAALRRGESGVSPLEGIPIARGKALAGQVKDPAFTGDRRLSLMAFHAVQEALAMSGAPPPSGTGLFLATVAGESRALEDRYQEFLDGQRPSRQLLAALCAYPNGSLADEIAAKFQLRGPREVNTNACASGNIAIARALTAIRLGQVRRALVVGADQLKATMYWGAERAGLIGHDLRPFHRDREGTLFGDGAGALLLESQEDAEARGAPVLAEIAGWGIACDENPHLIVPQLDGGANARAIERALRDGDFSPEEVDYFNAHGTGTVNIDRIEVLACKIVFGERAREVLVSATKSLTGHLSAASPILEAIACILSIRNGWVHPTAKLDHVDPSLDLDFVPLVEREHPTRCAVSNSMGGGGTNAAVVLCRPRTTPDPRSPASDEPIVITGAAALTPFGEGALSDWPRLAGSAAQAEARPAALRLHRFDVRGYVDASLNYQYMNRAAQVGLAAAILAVRHARLDFSAFDPERVAVVFGTAFGGSTAWATLLCEAYIRDPRRITPSMALEHGHHLGVTLAARTFNARGCNCTLTGGATAGLNAVGFAIDLLRTGACDAAVVGAMDILDEGLIRGLRLCGLLADGEGPPSRPYAEEASECRYSESAAALVLERKGGADRREATAHASIAGFGVDGVPVGPGRGDAAGEAISGAMAAALERSPDGDLVIFGAANGRGPADLAEAHAISELGRRRGGLHVTSIHGPFGETFASGGLLGVLSALSAMSEHRVPGLGAVAPRPYPGVEWLRGGSVARRVPLALVNSVASGGTAASLLLREVVR